MQSASVFSFILNLSILGILILPTAYAGKWTIVRNDDFVRKDGVEGDLRDVYCSNENHVWAVGARGLILHTADGGKTWTKKVIETESPTDFLRIYFWNANIGFITGTQPGGFRERSVLFMTKDGGNRWELRDPGVGGRVTGISMINDKVGFIVGGDNAFSRTSDGGETWEGSDARVRTGETRHNLSDISFGSPTHGWVVGSFGSIYHTSDGGATWEDQHSGVDNNLEAVHFVDEKTGWIAGQEGVILYTTDGGQTWTQQQTDSDENLVDIDLVDKQIGWAVGAFGTILHTSDGGQTWIRENTSTSTNLLAIDAADKDHCWTVGEWGLILRYGQ
jgi:photosystem II stability/assembly factor-like uncharacterized protein